MNDTNINNVPKISAEQLKEKIIEVFSYDKGKRYRKVNRTAFMDDSGKEYVCCSISKLYPKNPNPYWYGLNFNHFEKMKKIGGGYYIFGCMQHNKAYAIPLKVIEENIEHLNYTKTSSAFYWHIFINFTENGAILKLKKGMSDLNIEKYSFEVKVMNNAKFETDSTTDNEMAVDEMDGIIFGKIESDESEKMNNDGDNSEHGKESQEKSSIWWMVGVGALAFFLLK